jgi:hypothetical protein
MALIKCRECGREVSDKAKTCPGCGRKVKRPVGTLGILLAVLLGVAVFVPIISNSINAPATSTAKQVQLPPKACDRKLADKTLEQLNGVWYQIKGQTTLIKEGWYQLPLDQKRILDVLIHCHVYGHQHHIDETLAGPIELLLYKDYRTGKEVGSSSAWTGFKLL